MAEQITEDNKVIEQTENQETEPLTEEQTTVSEESTVAETTVSGEETQTDHLKTEESQSEPAREFAPHLKKRPIKEYYSFGDSDYEFSREDYIITRLRDEDLMEYLRMQEKKEEKQREAKEARNAKIYFLIMFAIAAIAVVLIVWFLRDNPAVLVNILYIAGILLVMWCWKHPKENGGK